MLVDDDDFNVFRWCFFILGKLVMMKPLRIMMDIDDDDDNNDDNDADDGDDDEDDDRGDDDEDDDNK